MSCIAVVTTLATRAEAQRMARALVERRLVACAQIAEIESVYRWNDAICAEPEFRLSLTTIAARYADVERAIRELHSYEMPAIHVHDLAPVYTPYADWVARESGASPGS